VSVGKKKSGGIPFLAIVRGDGSDGPRGRAGFERNARLELKYIETLKRPLGAKDAYLKGALERYLADPLKAAVEDSQQLLDRLASFGPRPRGSTSASTEYVRKLRSDNPALSWKELRKLALTDPDNKLGGMKEGRFRNIAGGARRPK
jgi:hypothetical protein